MDLSKSRLNKLLNSPAAGLLENINKELVDMWSNFDDFCKNHDSIYGIFSEMNLKAAQNSLFIINSDNETYRLREELLKNQISNYQDHIKFGNLSFLLGDLFSALLGYSFCLSNLDNESAFQKYLIAVCFTHFHMFDKALNLLETITNHLPVEVQHDALIRIALCHRYQKRYRSSLELFLRLSTVVTGRGKLSMAIEVAESYLLLGKYEEGIKFLQKYENEKTVDIIIELCYLMYLTEDISNCDSALAIALTSHYYPISASLQYVSIRLMWKRNHIFEALQSIKNSLEKNPKHAEIWCTLGLIYANNGQLNEAYNAFQKAIIFRPTMVEAWANVGALLELTKAPQDAIKLYEKAIKVTKAEIYFRSRINDLENGNKRIPMFVELNDIDYFVTPGKEIDMEFLQRAPAIPAHLFDNI